MDEAHSDALEDRLRADVRRRAIAHARRRAPRAPRGMRYGAVAVAVVLHILGAIWLYFLMKPHMVADTDRIAVRLLEATPPVPDLPQPPPPPKAAAKLVTTPTPAVSAARASTPAPASTPSAPAAVETSMQASISSAPLFNPDGSVRLAPAAKPSPHDEGMERARELMARGHNMLRCAKGTLIPSSGLSINERAAKAARKTRLMAFATQSPTDIAAQYDSRADIAAQHTSDSTIDRLTMIGEDCDDEFYRRPPPPPPTGKQ